MMGMEMVMKQLGIDPKKIMEDFSELKSGVTATLETINARLQRIEENQWKVQNGQPITPPSPSPSQPMQSTPQATPQENPSQLLAPPKMPPHLFIASKQ